MAKKHKKKIKIRDIILYSFFLIILFVVMTILFTRIFTGEANFFGLKIYSIQTNSMAPNYPAGSLVLETKNFNKNNIKKGDIITFDMNLENYDIPNTHRVVGFYYYDNINDTHASVYEYDTQKDFYKDFDRNQYEIIGFRTKGDNPAKDDEGNPLYPIDDRPVLFDDIQAKFLFKLSIFAYIYNIIMKPLGFVLIVIIPMVTIIVVQIISTIRAYKKKDEKDDEIENESTAMLDIDEIKRQAVEEYKKNHPELK